MQQRRLRLGDIVDDYCPRERRITNHAIVAMIDNEVKQTRCTTCDADHEYKQARIPAQRRKKDAPAALFGDVLAGMPRKRVAAEEPPDAGVPAGDDEPEPAPAAAAADTVQHALDLPDLQDETPSPVEDEGPVHRPLFRAKLPRPEGQVPERKLPDFTMRQRGAGANGNRQGRGPRRGPHMRAQQGGGGGQPTRFGGPRHGHGSGQGQRPGGGRPGQRSGSGHGQPGQQRQNRGGRKRGR